MKKKEITIKVDFPDEVTLSGLYEIIAELSNYDLNVVGKLIEKIDGVCRSNKIELNYSSFIKQLYFSHLFESGRRDFVDCDCHIGCCVERI